MSQSHSFAKAVETAKILVDTLQAQQVAPMEAMAATAIALGSMIAAGASSGITNPGQSGRLLTHLFKIAENQATEGMLQ